MLTRKQHELLVFIYAELKRTGICPSFDEMKDAMRLRSKAGIHRLVSALEERGFLARRHNRARALDVLRLPQNTAGGNLCTVMENAASDSFGHLPEAFDFSTGNSIRLPLHGQTADSRSATVVAAPFTPI